MNSNEIASYSSRLKQTKKYIAEIDVARAFGMILVVLGHTFPDAASTGGIQRPVYRIIYLIIYSFHMTLFIFVSGFVSGKFADTLAKKVFYIKKKVNRLIIPYLVWGIFYIPFRYLLSDYASANFNIADIWKVIIGENPYSGLWFLYALFLIMLIQIAVIDSLKKLQVALVISFVMLLLGKYVLIVEPLRWIFSYLFFFLLGFWASNNYETLYVSLNKGFVPVVSLVAFALLFFINNKFVNVFHGMISSTLSLLGIMFTLSVSIWLKDNIALRTAGKYGMEIFILSGPILVVIRTILYRKLGMEYTPYVLLALLIGYFVPILISKFIIDRSTILSMLLMGNKKQFL